MTDLQIRTSKTTTQIANKLRNVEYSEENVRSNIQALYDAMEARGYDGTINVLERNTPAKKKEMILLAVFELVLIIVAAAERMI